MTTDELLAYMYGLQRVGIKLGLSNITTLLARLGNPERRFKSIHVAGTNGKGSVCAMAASILQNAGHKVGLYTSPHLVRFNERIQVDRREISDGELAALVERAKPVVEALRSEDVHITFFELTTALAFQHFADRGCDWAVVEVGMGGRLDATNVLVPEASVITQIGWDHMKHLGNTITKIAGEKAGIIKPGVPVVTAAKRTALPVVEAKARELGCPPVQTVGRELATTLRSDTLDGIVIDLRTPSRKYRSLVVPLLGAHQAENAALAVAALEAVPSLGLTEVQVREGLARTSWPGRLHVLSREPVVLLDAAHNPPGAKVLAAAVDRYLADYDKQLVFGMLGDKAYRRVARMLCPSFRKVWVTSPGSERALAPEVLAKHVRKHTEAEVVPDAREAYRRARASLGKNGALVIAGSVYLAGEVLAEAGSPG